MSGAILGANVLNVEHLDYFLRNYSFYDGLDVFFIQVSFGLERYSYNGGKDRLKYINVYSCRGEGSGSWYLHDLILKNRNTVEILECAVEYLSDPYYPLCFVDFPKLAKVPSYTMLNKNDIYLARFPLLRSYYRKENFKDSEIVMKVIEANQNKIRSCITLILAIRKFYIIPREIVKSIVDYVIYGTVPSDWLDPSKMGPQRSAKSIKLF